MDVATVTVGVAWNAMNGPRRPAVVDENNPENSCCNPVSIAEIDLGMPSRPTAELEFDSAMTLSQAGVGCDVRIRLLSGPSCDRLRDMGFCEQLQIRKLANGRNLICSVCGTRLAISKDLADQVLVESVA